MKRTLFAGLSLAFIVGLAAIPGSANAQSNFDANTGCGLGTMAIKEGDSVLLQILAVTTNQILGNQTFGISSGTLGCKQPSRVVQDERLQRFVAENMDSIAHDIASGGGESLDTLSELMSVPSEKRAEFYASLQTNFKKIYASEGVQSADVIDNIASIN